MSIFDALNPINVVVKTATDLIGKFVADPKQRAEAELVLVQAHNAAAAAVLDAQKTLVEQQAKVVVTEAQGNWLERDWRPLLMLFFGVVIGFVVFNGAHDFEGREIPAGVVDWVLKIVALGVGGYVGEPLITALKGNGRRELV